MIEKYSTESSIRRLVDSFENASISRDDWKHAEHLVVALYYVSRYGIETATEKMRAGIINLLSNGFKIDPSAESPYHETMTLFWMRTVDSFNAANRGLRLHERAEAIVKTFDKDYPLKFYSRGHLFSDSARNGFVAPDL